MSTSARFIVYPLKKYSYCFWGRKQGAIGVFYPIAGTLQATCEESAIESLRHEYEAYILQAGVEVKESRDHEVRDQVHRNE